MLRRYAAFLLIPALLLVAAGASAQGGQAAAAKPAAPGRPETGAGPTAKGPRPEQFTFQPLTFTPPKPADYRVDALERPRRLHRARTTRFPWINASLLVRTGPFLEPKDKLGVAA